MASLRLGSKTVKLGEGRSLSAALSHAKVLHSAIRSGVYQARGAEWVRVELSHHVKAGSYRLGPAPARNNKHLGVLAKSLVRQLGRK